MQICSKCRSDLTVKDNKGYFTEFAIINQLVLFFKRPGFYENLQYRFKRQKKYSDCIEDIYHGCIYEKHFEDDGFLSNTDNISFLSNTDGISLFKSSKISIWPIFLVINELESKHRYKSENMLFAGIWYSSKNPEASLFLEPLYKELKLLRNGVTVKVPISKGSHISRLVKAILIAGTFNLPARCLVSSTVQFNGKYGCIKCFQIGESCTTAKGGHVWVYPFNNENPKGPLRDHESLKKHALEAYHENNTQHGYMI